MCCRGNCKVGYGDYTLNIRNKKKVIATNSRFEIVCNSHFYNYSLHRSVVVATIKLGMMSLP